MSEETPRRDTAPDDTGTSESGSETSSTAGEDAGRETVPLEAISTRELLVWVLGVLGAKAWQGLGLVPNPGSGKIEKDLGDAKVAIDAFAGLLEAMRPQLEGRALRDTEALLTTLRLNFVEKSGEK
ncbi:MAG: DUF1844 domain-containing protein [bacterium]